MLLPSFLLYIGVGASLGVVTTLLPGARRRICHMAARARIPVVYALAVWLGGTTIAWPIGLYVLATGRLILVGNAISLAVVGKAAIRWESEHIHQPSILETRPR